MATGSDQSGIAHFEQLCNNLEFENQQYVKMIDDENQRIAALKTTIQEKTEQLQRKNDDTFNMDEQIKELQKRFSWCKENHKCLENTRSIMVDHTAALSKELNTLKAKAEEERKYYDEEIDKYTNIKEDYLKKYETFPLAQELAKKKEELRIIQEREKEIESKRKELSQKKAEKEAYLDRRILTRQIVKLARLKLADMDIENDINKCMEEKAKLSRQLKEIEKSKHQIDDESYDHHEPPSWREFTMDIDQEHTSHGTSNSLYDTQKEVHESHSVEMIAASDELDTEDFHHTATRSQNQGHFMLTQALEIQGTSSQAMLTQEMHSQAMLTQERHSQAMLTQERHSQAMLTQERHSQAVPTQERHSQAVPTQERHSQAMLTQERHSQAMLTQGRHSQAMPTQERHSQAMLTQERHSQAMLTQERHSQAMLTQERHSQAMPTQERHSQAMLTQERHSQAVPNQRMHSQAVPNQRMHSQAVPTQGMHSMAVPNQRMHSQAVPNHGMHSQAVPNQRMHSQAVPNQGMHSQAVPNQRMHSQAVPNQGMHSQAVPNQGMHSQAVPNQRMHSQAMPTQGMHSQAVPNQRMHSLAVPNQRMHSQAVPNQRMHSLALSFQAIQTATVSSRSMQNQIMPNQVTSTKPLPSQSMPTQSISSQSLPTQSLPTQSMPTQSMPTQSMPTQSKLAQSLQTPSMLTQSLQTPSMPTHATPTLPTGESSKFLTNTSSDYHGATNKSKSLGNKESYSHTELKLVKDTVERPLTGKGIQTNIENGNQNAHQSPFKLMAGNSKIGVPKFSFSIPPPNRSAVRTREPNVTAPRLPPPPQSQVVSTPRRPVKLFEMPRASVQSNTNSESEKTHIKVRSPSAPKQMSASMACRIRPFHTLSLPKFGNVSQSTATSEGSSAQGSNVPAASIATKEKSKFTLDGCNEKTVNLEDKGNQPLFKLTDTTEPINDNPGGTFNLTMNEASQNSNTFSLFNSRDSQETGEKTLDSQPFILNQMTDSPISQHDRDDIFNLCPSWLQNDKEPSTGGFSLFGGPSDSNNDNDNNETVSSLLNLEPVSRSNPGSQSQSNDVRNGFFKLGANFDEDDENEGMPRFTLF